MLGLFTIQTPARRRLIACVVLAVAAWLLALMLAFVPPTRGPLDKAGDYFYDAFYHLRPREDQTAGPIVIVAVDQKSLDAVDKTFKFGWPWPRELYGHISQYLEHAGARAVAFDLLFSETSAYQDRTGDDDAFAEAIKNVKIPVIFGAMVTADGAFGRFAPPVAGPTFGAVNVGDDKVYRRYPPEVFGQPSLATAAVSALHQPLALRTDHPFLLHYYGPYQDPRGRTTFRYVSAADVLAAQLAGPAASTQPGALPPELFRNKIVLIGAITAGAYDLKASPLSAEYPGVEVQATALGNLLDGRQVVPLGGAWQILATLLAALAATAGVIYPRRAALKALAPVVVLGGLLGVAAWLFTRGEIRWLSPVAPLLALAFATLAGFAWTYLAEDRQRRFMLKALSKVVSPAVAEQLAREPERLALGTTRGELTVLFTDLANFTDLSEAMDVQKLGAFMNRYLGYLSDEVLAHDGTLDKYIGDAIMCFWNAPLPQADHALRACRTALAIRAKEQAVQAELRQFGVSQVRTRIGINTATVAVGFVGSNHLFNYTALGDGVNLASRLEGANKLYGSQILLSETTAALVREHFLLRKVDVLRVKGKRQPMAVYELLGERGADSALEAMARAYEAAFAAYQNRQWDQAEEALCALLKPSTSVAACDSVSQALLKRLDRLRRASPAEGWDGVYDATEK